MDKNDLNESEDKNDVDKEQILTQYRYIKELSQLKYDAEEKREQNLIQQSSQMQTVFSFMTVAIFMAMPVFIEYRSTIGLKFFLVSISITIAFLLTSLVLASLAQWRWQITTFPDIKDIKSFVIENPEWQKLLEEYNQMDQWVNLVEKVQARKAKLNNRRAILIMCSMASFYGSIVSIIISFIVAMIILI